MIRLLNRLSDRCAELGERPFVPRGGPCERQPAQRDALFAQFVAFAGVFGASVFSPAWLLKASSTSFLLFFSGKSFSNFLR